MGCFSMLLSTAVTIQQALWAFPQMPLKQVVSPLHPHPHRSWSPSTGPEAICWWPFTRCSWFNSMLRCFLFKDFQKD